MEVVQFLWFFLFFVFWGKGWDDGGHDGMSFYVQSRGLEDMMFVCVGGVDSERQNWEVSEFLCCRGLKDMVFACVGLMRDSERELGGAVFILFPREKSLSN